MTVLLNCFMSYSQNDSITSSTGRVEDSVLIAYSDLRKVNIKLVELDYEKEINAKLKDIIHNDSVAIAVANSTITRIVADNKRTSKRLKRQRNGAIIGGAGLGVLLLISIIK